MRNFKQLQYNASMETALAIVKEWVEAKPDNDNLAQLSKCLVDIYTYVASMELERNGFDLVVDRLRDERTKLAQQLQDKNNLYHDLELQEKFSREISDDINERLNNLL